MYSLNIRKAIYIFTIAAVSVQLFGCFDSGDGGSDYPPYNPAWVEINNPETDPNYTESESQYISGEAFISDNWYRCCSGSAEDTGVTVTWRNVTTGVNANANQWVRYCVSFFSYVYLCDHYWSSSVPLAMGVNKIVVTASDPDYSNTDTITITREPDTIPPVVSSTIPTDLATDVAVNTPVKVIFSEEMDCGTINIDTVLLSGASGQVAGTVTCADHTATFAPAYDLSYETQYSVNVTTAVKDISGNTLTEEYSWNFTTGDTPDTTPPEVTSVYPVDGTECVSINSSLWAYFSETMTPESINNNSFTLTDLGTGNKKSGLVGYTDLKATLQPYSSLAIGTSYMATITSDVADLVGNNMNANYSWMFNTPLDTSGEWRDTSITNAPSSRWLHTAVWTGNEMIIWGGNISTLYDEPGGLYHPETDSWRLTAIIDKRRRHTAVWTGNEMIVWGGEGPDGRLNTGGRYNPVTDSWLPTSLTNAPAPRVADLAVTVWTGSELIIWGGKVWDNDANSDTETNTGGRYNPVTDSWQPTSTTGAPQARFWGSAVWTGEEMLVWGGFASSLTNTGGRYNPETDSWQPMSTIGAPSPNYGSHAIWTGSEMIVWGGYRYAYSGGIYNPVTDSWRPISTECASGSNDGNTAIWDGNKMIIWGSIGSSYDPLADTWYMLPIINAPTARSEHTAVWTGTEMIIWGGLTNTGGRYTQITDK